MELGAPNRRRVWALVGMLALFCASCAGWPGGLTPPEVHVANLVPLESTIFEQRVRVDLRVHNPNDRELEVTGVDFVLYVNGTRLARGLSGEAFTLPRLGEALVSVVATTTLVDLTRQVLQLGETSELEYALRGRLHLAGGLRRTLEFERTGAPLSADGL